MKILISGVSGIGKTTLAQELSKKYKIPFIIGSSKVLWKKYNIASHKELIEKCSKSIQFGLDFQYELLEYRMREMSNHERFVTDRAPLDNLVYFMLQMSASVSQAQTVDYINECIKGIPENSLSLYLKYDKQVILEMGEIENDGARIVNQYYQLMVANVFDMIINNKVLNMEFDIISKWDMDYRMDKVNTLLNRDYGGRGKDTNNISLF